MNKENTPKKHTKRKIVLVVVLVLMCAVGALSWYLVYGKPEVLDKALENASDDIIGMYGSTESYIYYPVDYDLDITSVREYMERDRTVHYTYGAESVSLTDENIDNYGEDVKFFVMYFYYAINGDYETYNTLFTDNFYKTNEPYSSFTSQMIYDINVEKLSKNAEGSTVTYGYNVSYKIYRNNGTFRNDIGSDGSKTLYFELQQTDDTVKIDRITYYK